MLQKFYMKSVIYKDMILLRYVGLWPKGDKYFEYNTYTCFSVILILSLMILDYLCVIMDVYVARENFERLANVLSFLAQKSITLMQMIFFLRNVKIRNQIMKKLNLDMMQPKNDRQRKIVENSLWIYNTIASGYFWCCSVTCIFYFLLPVIMGVREFPFDAWYPYPAYKSPWFELTYIHQCAAAGWNHFAHTAIEIFCAGLMATIGSQCDLLSDKLRNSKEIDRNEGDGNVSSLGEIAVDRHDLFFRSIIEHHQQILLLSKEVNDLFSFLVFGELSLVAVLLCTALFRLSVVKEGGFESFLLIGYIVSMSLQLFLYCWFGAEVDEKSQKLHSATFQCEWIGSSSGFQKNLIFFMGKTNTPIKMYALYFFPLSIVTFTSVIRSSWSFFVLLQQMNQ